MSPRNESIPQSVLRFTVGLFFREKNGIANACVINFPSVLLYHGMPKYDEIRPALDFLMLKGPDQAAHITFLH